MPRTNNPYLPMLRSPAANSFASLVDPVSPVRPSRRSSPRKTPSPNRKARSSVSISIFGAFFNTVKGKKHSGPQLRSPNRSPAGSGSKNTAILRKMPSFPGLRNRSQLRSPLQRRRIHVSQISAPHSSWKHSPTFECFDLAGADADMDSAEPSVENDEAGDEGQYVTVMPRRRFLSVTSSPDPFRTPPRTPATAPPLSPVEFNGSPESIRSRRRRDRERSFIKSLQILGVEATGAASQQYARAWDL
ncbi:hypothetical protein DXG03_001862 [Asterophora parasitica]|uniref:Uncharacterized protein n=1 Tax=Asterophora parasitica TaxID=117018 RepID=A0A9P7KBC3_9AGAR|nr:hypothetical protein DXG03_001862 [Asterophora parasitica]